MCTLKDATGEAMVCDVALSMVHAALAAEPACLVSDEPVAGEGTRVRLIKGDPLEFARRVSDAIAEINR